ncbi:14430_t:CDS:2, partial [Racocetra persica]
MSSRNSRQIETKNTTKSLAPKKYVTRKEKRKARLFNRYVIVKQIKDQIRHLSKEIRGIPREDESIKSRIKWFTRLKEFTETSSADNLSLFENIYLNFEAKKKKSDAVITSLCQETNRLRAELSIGTNNYIVTNESSNESSKSGDEMDVSPASRAATSISSNHYQYLPKRIAADSTSNLLEQITETTSNQPLPVVNIVPENRAASDEPVEFSEQSTEESTKESSEE